ncbi:MAG: SigE family RNA polymerase sigma factor [Propionibacteriaceae bacterium]|nr:SigE family RNA polymerase sigma factor [Propionibacteriaceae bacterium]
MQERPEVHPRGDGARDGGARTFDEYVRDRSVALQRFAYLVTRHPEDARDAVQDALVGLWPRFQEVRARGDVDAYVHRSIVNASVSRWRRTRRLVPVETPEDLPQAAASGFEEAVTDAHVAWELVGTLPHDRRAAVVLRYWSGLSFAEIADVLGCAEATARSHVHRALTQLRTRLVEEER